MENAQARCSMTRMVGPLEYGSRERECSATAIGPPPLSSYGPNVCVTAHRVDRGLRIAQKLLILRNNLTGDGAIWRLLRVSTARRIARKAWSSTGTSQNAPSRIRLSSSGTLVLVPPPSTRLAGICPGPALVALGTGQFKAIVSSAGHPEHTEIEFEG